MKGSIKKVNQIQLSNKHGMSNKCLKPTQVAMAGQVCPSAQAAPISNMTTIIIVVVMMMASRGSHELAEATEASNSSVGFNSSTWPPSLGLEPRIGGSPVERGQWPFQVGVFTVRENKLICGGALIDRNRILTSLSCLIAGVRLYTINELFVKVGDHELGKLDEGEMSLNLGRIEVNAANRLGLLFTDRELRFNSNVRAIRLPSEGPITGQMYFTGWGNSRLGLSFSKSLKIQKITLKPCNKPTEMTICSRQEQSTPSLCQGDIGGPLFNLIHAGGAELVGVLQVSSSIGCNACNNPNCDHEFTNISTVLHWLAVTI